MVAEPTMKPLTRHVCQAAHGTVRFGKLWISAPSAKDAAREYQKAVYLDRRIVLDAVEVNGVSLPVLNVSLDIEIGEPESQEARLR